MAERLRAWVGEGRFAWAFDNRADSLQLGRLTAFDVTEFLDNPDLRTPITSYLLYRTEPLIDGTPFALWIDEFWKILDDAYFEGFVRDKLKTIRKKDGIVVTSTQSPADALDSKISAALLEQTPTKIFLPNEYADEGDYRDGFKLTPAEWALLRPLTKSSRKFLLKQAAGSALVDFNLSGRDGAGMDAEMAILSGTERSIRLADRIAEEHGGDAARGLDFFARTEETYSMKRPILAAALAMAIGVNGNLHATGVPVFDASNLAQAITQAQTLAEQLTALKDQLDTLRAQAATSPICTAKCGASRRTP